MMSISRRSVQASWALHPDSLHEYTRHGADLPNAGSRPDGTRVLGATQPRPARRAEDHGVRAGGRRPRWKRSAVPAVPPGRAGLRGAAAHGGAGGAELVA